MALPINLNPEDVLESAVSMGKIIESEDRHDLSNFLYMIREDTGGKTVGEESFKLFRSGFVLDKVLNLETALSQKGRQLQSSELLDKINYLSLVPDIESLNQIFTDQRIIKGVSQGNHDLSYWFDCGTLENLPTETRTKIAAKFLEIGDVKKANHVLKTVTASLELERTSTKDNGKTL